MRIQLTLLEHVISILDEHSGLAGAQSGHEPDERERPVHVAEAGVNDTRLRNECVYMLRPGVYVTAPEVACPGVVSERREQVDVLAFRDRLERLVCGRDACVQAGR